MIMSREEKDRWTVALLTTQKGNSCRKLIAKPVTNGVPDELSYAMRRTPSYSQGVVQSGIKGPR